MNPRPINYRHELGTLIDLIKSSTPEADRVIEVLRSGDEGAIRRMLVNFGNPQDEVWKDVTAASPWSGWQIDQLIADRGNIFPTAAGVPFWIWNVDKTGQEY